MNKRHLSNWIFTIIIGSIVLFSLAPVLWQLLTSIKVNADIAAIPNVYLPGRFTWQHYTELFDRRPFLLYLINSFLVASLSTLLCLPIGSLAAYALARLNLSLERPIIAGLFIITLFPYILLFIGVLEIIRFFDIANNYLALIIPYTAINLPLTILVMRSFFLQLPREIEDAARLDGYKLIPMLISIVLPLSLPALVTTGILTFIFAWNEYLFALTFISEENLKTIPVAVAGIGSSSVFEIPYGPIAAATVLGTLPLVILVLFFQRRIVSGLTAGAVKG